MPAKLAPFLGHDFFGVGCGPGDARLRNLHVSGRLDGGKGYANAVDVATLADDLVPLLKCSLSRNFTLDVVFRTELGVSHFDRRCLATLAATMSSIWSILRPFFEQLERMGDGVGVNFLMLTKCKIYMYTTGGGARNDGYEMLETKEEWYADLERTLGSYCYDSVAKGLAVWRRPEDERENCWVVKLYHGLSDLKKGFRLRKRERWAWD